MVQQTSPHYLAYLARLWREEEGVWRGTLENPHTGERWAFADLEALFAFMREQTAVSSSAGQLPAQFLASPLQVE